MSLADFGVFASEMLGDAPCGVASTSADGRLIYANRTLAGWMGTCPDAMTDGKRVQDLLTMPGRIYFETHVAPMLRLQGFAREIACELDCPGKRPLPVMMNGVLRPPRGNQAERIDYTFFDATERAEYERSLRRARAEADQLAAVVRSSPNAIIRTDDKGIVESWNRGAERLFGHSAIEALGQPAETLIPLKDEPAWLTARAPACHGVDGVHFEAEHPGGTILEVTIASIGEAEWRSGRAAYSAILRDVTARVRVQRQLHLMVSEMRHRVKNTLAVVLSIARQTFAGTEHSEPARIFQERLGALARAQDLFSGETHDSARLGALAALCVEQAGGAERMHASGPNLLLRAQAASTLAMALHELTTNAIKYGALSTRDGRVALTWSLEEAERGSRIEMLWQETGGPPVAPPERRGFGSKMIEIILVAEFEGRVTFDYRPEGLILRTSLRYDPPPGRMQGVADRPPAA